MGQHVSAIGLRAEHKLPHPHRVLARHRLLGSHPVLHRSHQLPLQPRKIPPLPVRSRPLPIRCAGGSAASAGLDHFHLPAARPLHRRLHAHRETEDSHCGGYGGDVVVLGLLPHQRVPHPPSRLHIRGPVRGHLEPPLYRHSAGLLAPRSGHILPQPAADPATERHPPPAAAHRPLPRIPALPVLRPAHTDPPPAGGGALGRRGSDVRHRAARHAVRTVHSTAVLDHRARDLLRRRPALLCQVRNVQVPTTVRTAERQRVRGPVLVQAVQLRHDRSDGVLHHLSGLHGAQGGGAAGSPDGPPAHHRVHGLGPHPQKVPRALLRPRIPPRSGRQGGRVQRRFLPSPGSLRTPAAPSLPPGRAFAGEGAVAGGVLPGHSCAAAGRAGGGGGSQSPQSQQSLLPGRRKRRLSAGR
mmetsp:Transcript_22535/g.50090  ORF Transcript_22535/g.50090 Transcript_22535/m.50090 type:complete len:412 (-) Transcript_22535:153-1388(-)